MNFENVLGMVFEYVREYDKDNDFQEASEKIKKIVFGLPKEKLLPLINQMGIIPEKIAHDSKEEKLFTRMSEIFLARCYEEIGLVTSLYSKRSDVADVYAKSNYHNYFLVSDAKAFRLSRTAKNQKDFKVESMDAWRGNADYAVLCCPYFQYPRNRSAIYKQAIDKNVMLFSWEHFYFLIRNGVRESLTRNLSKIWNYSKIRSKKVKYDQAKDNFLEKQNKFIAKHLDLQMNLLKETFANAKDDTVWRSSIEKRDLQEKIKEIQEYNREEAISALLDSLKLDKKIEMIDKYIESIKGLPL